MMGRGGCKMEQNPVVSSSPDLTGIERRAAARRGWKQCSTLYRHHFVQRLKTARNGSGFHKSEWLQTLPCLTCTVWMVGRATNSPVHESTVCPLEMSVAVFRYVPIGPLAVFIRGGSLVRRWGDMFLTLPE